MTFGQQRDQDAQEYKVIGHYAQMQRLTRLRQDTTTAYGDTVAKGTVFFLRQDFDTVENPFAFSTSDQIGSKPRAGVHFIGFGPSAQRFEKMRLGMNGVEQSSGTTCPTRTWASPSSWSPRSDRTCCCLRRWRGNDRGTRSAARS